MSGQLVCEWTRSSAHTGSRGARAKGMRTWVPMQKACERFASLVYCTVSGLVGGSCARVCRSNVRSVAVRFVHRGYCSAILLGRGARATVGVAQWRDGVARSGVHTNKAGGGLVHSRHLALSPHLQPVTHTLPPACAMQPSRSHSRHLSLSPLILSLSRTPPPPLPACALQASRSPPSKRADAPSFFAVQLHPLSLRWGRGDGWQRSVCGVWAYVVCAREARFEVAVVLAAAHELGVLAEHFTCASEFVPRLPTRLRLVGVEAPHQRIVGGTHSIALKTAVEFAVVVVGKAGDGVNAAR